MDAKGKRQQDQLGTDPVPSKSGKKSTVGKKRKPKAIDLVAKKTGISRDNLMRGERLAKQDPALAEKVETGSILLADAEKRSGIEPKKRETKRKQKFKARRKTGSLKTKDSDAILFADEQSEIVDHSSGMRVITSFNVIVVQHPNSELQAIVLHDQDVCRVLTTGGRDEEIDCTESEAIGIAKSLVAETLLEAAR